MKLYISLPISGRSLEDAKNRAEFLKKQFSNPYVKVITPFDVCPEPDRPYSYYMGRDIEALLECDAIYLDEGWQDSKGCNCEYSVATIYGLTIYQHKDFQIIINLN